MVSVDYSLLVQIVNFILLILILNVVLYKPIRGFLRNAVRQSMGSMRASMRPQLVFVRGRRHLQPGSRKGVPRALSSRTRSLMRRPRRRGASSGRSPAVPKKILSLFVRKFLRIWLRCGRVCRVKWMILQMQLARRFWGGHCNVFCV